jgi:hypothetical protein
MMRDDYRCAYCTCKLDDYTGTLDHVIPISQGGSSTPRNLVAACKGCNGAKRDRPAAALGRPDLVGERCAGVQPPPEPVRAGPTPLGVNCQVRRYTDRAGAVRSATKRVLGDVAIYGDELARLALRRPDDLVYHCPRCDGFHLVRPARKVPSRQRVAGTGT